MKIRNTLAPLLLSSLLLPPLAAQQETGDLPDVETRLEALRAEFEAAPSRRAKTAAAEEALRLARLEGRDVDVEEAMVLHLVGRIQESLQTSTPFPFAFDAAGTMTTPQVTPEFEEWAASSGLELGAALKRAMYEQPAEVASLYGSSDPLAVATFREALGAENLFVAATAAKALSLIDHTESVDEVIALSYTVPGDVAVSVADSLERFSDPSAQARAVEMRSKQ